MKEMHKKLQPKLDLAKRMWSCFLGVKIIKPVQIPTFLGKFTGFSFISVSCAKLNCVWRVLAVRFFFVKLQHSVLKFLISHFFYAGTELLALQVMPSLMLSEIASQMWLMLICWLLWGIRLLESTAKRFKCPLDSQLIWIFPLFSKLHYYIYPCSNSIEFQNIPY